MNIYLTDASASVEIKAGKIVLRNNEELFEFPIRTVDEVCIGGNADVSSKVISKLAENGINVSLMHGNNIVSLSMIIEKDDSVRLYRMPDKTELVNEPDQNNRCRKRSILV